MPFTIGGDWIAPEEEPSKQGGKKSGGGRPVKVRELKRGKATLTVVLNLNLSESEITDLAQMLKRKCGCGGTVRDGSIELQGHRAAQVTQLLTGEGIKAQ